MKIIYKAKLEKDIRCPLEYGLDIFSGKWKSRIICILGKNEHMRYGQLRKSMLNITDAVLSTTLKELIADEIILRKKLGGLTLHVEYSLTEKGISLIPLMQSICSWSNTYYKERPQLTLQQCEDCEHCKQ